MLYIRSLIEDRAVFDFYMAFAVEEGLRNPKDLAKENEAHKRRGYPEDIVVAKIAGDVASGNTTDETAAGEEESVDGLHIKLASTKINDADIGYNGTASLMHEKDLSNNIRCDCVCGSEAEALHNSCSYNAPKMGIWIYYAAPD